MKRRVVRDESHEGLAALLMQKNEKGNLELISSASRQFSGNQSNCPTNELQSFAIVMPVAHFRNYNCGANLTFSVPKGARDRIKKQSWKTNQPKKLKRLMSNFFV